MYHIIGIKVPYYNFWGLINEIDEYLQFLATLIYYYELGNFINNNESHRRSYIYSKYQDTVHDKNKFLDFERMFFIKLSDYYFCILHSLHSWVIQVQPVCNKIVTIKCSSFDWLMNEKFYQGKSLNIQLEFNVGLLKSKFDKKLRYLKCVTGKYIIKCLRF